MYGEGNWKADAEYRQGVKDFSQSHDAAARGAATELDEDEEANEVPPSKDENEW
jgi:hypothetical protein